MALHEYNSTLASASTLASTNDYKNDYKTGKFEMMVCREHENQKKTHERCTVSDEPAPLAGYVITLAQVLRISTK